MDNDYYAVKWIHENPIRYSVMQRCDFATPEDKAKESKTLLGQEIKFKWKKHTCAGIILDSGLKLEMEKFITEVIRKTKISIEVIAKRGRPIGKVSALKNTNKLRKLDHVISGLNEDSGNSLPLNPTPIVSDYKSLFEEEKEKHEKLRVDYEIQKVELGQLQAEVITLKTENQVLRERGTSATDTDIGNGVLVKTEWLTTIKSVSTSVNVFARNLFRKLFETPEVVGYTLMGKACNARGCVPQPSVDGRRRDAIIEFSLQTFGVLPGSPEYKCMKKDLKKSLATLIFEITKEYKAQVQMVEDELGSG